jgi:hypothetical protein
MAGVQHLLPKPGAGPWPVRPVVPGPGGPGPALRQRSCYSCSHRPGQQLILAHEHPSGVSIDTSLIEYRLEIKHG